MAPRQFRLRHVLVVLQLAKNPLTRPCLLAASRRVETAFVAQELTEFLIKGFGRLRVDLHAGRLDTRHGLYRRYRPRSADRICQRCPYTG